MSESSIINTHSYINYGNILLGLLISISLHIGFILYASLTSSPIIIAQFWYLAFIDTIMVATGLIPIIAFIRKEIHWYDPIFLFGCLYLGMTATYFVAFLFDPAFTRYHTSLSGYTDIRNMQYPKFIVLIVKSELLLIVFNLIVLFFNKYPVNNIPIRIKQHENKASVLTMILLFSIGLLFFISRWSDQSYLEAITVNIGSDQVKNVEFGQARFVIISEIGRISLSLGIIGVLSYFYPRSKFLASVIVLTASMLTILMQLAEGSRIGILFALVQFALISVWFGYRPHKLTYVIGGLVIILLVSSITIIRDNRLLSRKPNSLLTQLVSGEARQEYLSSVDSQVLPFLALDRIGPIALIINHLEKHDDYLYGNSLVAGIVNLSNVLLLKLGLINIQADDGIPWANESIKIWVFGKVVRGGAIPPSIPGEFYMQWGWLPFLFLSAIFGWFIAKMRISLEKSTNLITRWLLLVFTLTLIFFLPTEISGMSSMFLYYPLVVLVYLLFAMILRRYDPIPSVQRSKPLWIRR